MADGLYTNTTLQTLWYAAELSRPISPTQPFFESNWRGRWKGIGRWPADKHHPSGARVATQLSRHISPTQPFFESNWRGRWKGIGRWPAHKPHPADALVCRRAVSSHLTHPALVAMRLATRVQRHWRMACKQTPLCRRSRMLQSCLVPSHPPSLPHNNIGDTGAKALADDLRKNTALQKL